MLPTGEQIMLPAPESLCLFERSSRIGGRTYSVSVTPDKRLGHIFVLDVGSVPILS